MHPYSTTSPRPAHHADALFVARRTAQARAVRRVDCELRVSGDGTRIYVGLENEDKVAAVDALTTAPDGSGKPQVAQAIDPFRHALTPGSEPAADPAHEQYL